jgi:hypothetical protein
MKYLTFEELCLKMGLSKYEMRYHQACGFFSPEENELLLDPSEPLRHYDARWVKVWQEFQLYLGAGLTPWTALEYAKRDVY